MGHSYPELTLALALHRSAAETAMKSLPAPASRKTIQMKQSKEQSCILRWTHLAVLLIAQDAVQPNMTQLDEPLIP